MAFSFSHKSETLKQLKLLVKSARILPQVAFSVADWEKQKEEIMQKIFKQPWAKKQCIVRSSSSLEDSSTGSLAGKYHSVLHVKGKAVLEKAIDKVKRSYGRAAKNEQIFVQPMITDISMGGVAFSCDPATGAPYIVINYEEGENAAAITSGSAEKQQVFYYWKHQAKACSDRRLHGIIKLIKELEKATGSKAIDIEFAYDNKGVLYLFQVRPLVLSGEVAGRKEHKKLLQTIADKVRTSNCPHPYLHGKKTVYGIMPDWNPAEIIGIRPRPLSLSLYKEMITDSVWAYQRHNYGYMNLRSFPLLIHFFGLPYIDVRVSFNSFIPSDLEDKLANKLANFYLERLISYPTLHDKIEFEIIFSCYTFGIREKLKVLQKHGFKNSEIDTIRESLRHLTNNIIHRDRGLWKLDTQKIAELERRHKLILDSDLDRISRIYWLVEDCKRYGTLPFAGLARAGFIAIQLLQSLVNHDIISKKEYDNFMSTNVETVTGQMKRDLQEMSKETFLAKYGHLRPGTYDILSKRYDEAPDDYFDWSKKNKSTKSTQDLPFSLSLEQMKAVDNLLHEHDLEYDLVGLFDFIRSGIQGREHAKFIFTRSLSDAMSLLKALGEEHGFSDDDISFLNANCVSELYGGSMDIKAVLESSIKQGKEQYNLTQQISLPPFITDESDVWSFHYPMTEPNFVTQNQITAPIVHDIKKKDQLTGAIVMITNADPGYDWVFSRNIGGLITAYGGANSHMAIRANELGMPAVIGCGKELFEKWSRANTLQIDCSNRMVNIIK